MLPFVLFAAFGCSGSDGAKPGKHSTEEPKAPMVNVPDTITPSPAPTAQPAVSLTPTHSTWWRALDHLAEGTYQFPADIPGESTDGNFVLNGKWVDEGARKGGWHSYSIPLPFATNMPRPNYAPMGARLLRAGKEVAFNTTIAAPTREPIATWYVDHGRIVILADDNPNGWTEPATLVVEELAADIRKRSLTTSGLQPAEFARQLHHAERTERPSLYLPAPASASFPVTVPESANLNFGLGLLDDPLTGKPSGDGAEVVVQLDGVEIWKGRVEVDGLHVAVSVPVKGVAGKPSTLSIATLPGAGSGGDYVVLTNPVIVDAAVKTPRRIVVIGVDTLRWDELGANGYARNTSPELDQWLAQSVQFDNAYSPAPRTKPSFRTAFTGLFPSHTAGAPTIADKLSKVGFSTAGFVGNVHLVPRFGFSRGMDHWEYENGARGADQVERALTWLKAHENEDSFMFVHLMDPHTFYNAPDDWADRYTRRDARPKGVPAKFDRWQIINLDKKRKIDDGDKEWIRGQYDAEVSYAAFQVARLMAALDTLPGPTLTVLHTDHGEEMWDHHGFEHNHSVYNELVHVELAVRPPKGWQGAPHVAEPVSLADLSPTILDFAGVPEGDRGKTDGYSLRPLIDASAAASVQSLKDTLLARPLPLGHMRYERDRWGVVFNSKKYILHTSSGKQEFFDLAADPKEQNDVLREADPAVLAQMREALGKATGWPVRKGIRLRVPTGAEVTAIKFDAPIVATGILDPQWNAKIRANTEWGETPPVSVADVGEVALSTDQKTATYTPGANPFGQAWWVQCAADPCPDGVLTMGKKTVRLSKADNFAGGTRYSIEAGYVLVPDDTSDAPEVAAAVPGTDIEALQTLGYLQKEKDDQD